MLDGTKKKAGWPVIKSVAEGGVRERERQMFFSFSKKKKKSSLAKAETVMSLTPCL